MSPRSQVLPHNFGLERKKKKSYISSCGVRLSKGSRHRLCNGPFDDDHQPQALPRETIRDPLLTSPDRAAFRMLCARIVSDNQCGCEMRGEGRGWRGRRGHWEGGEYLASFDRFISYFSLAHVLLDVVEREEFWACISLALPDSLGSLGISRL